MVKKRLRVAMTCSIVWSLVLLGIAAPGAAEDLPPFRPTPIVLQASQVLPANLLKGPNYEVAETVNNDGFFNIYQLITPSETIQVESTAMLMIRISEMGALIAMDETSRSKEFGKALAGTAVAPLKTAGAMVTSPVKTTGRIFKGTGRFLGNLGRSVTSRDPHQDNVLKTALGYDTAKRTFAYEFGINPYTSNEPVSNSLASLSRSAVGGGLTTTVAVALLVPNPAGLIVGLTATAEDMRQLVRDNPPGALKRINKKKLEAMGIEENLAEAFLKNYSYNPQEATILVGELDTLKGVEDRGVFLSIATLAQSESEALYNRIVVQMLAAYHARIAPGARMVNVGGEPMMQRADGGLVWVGAVDHVFWTVELGDDGYLGKVTKAIAQMPEVTTKEIVISGVMDQTVRDIVTSRGWTVQENFSPVPK